VRFTNADLLTNAVGVSNEFLCARACADVDDVYHSYEESCFDYS